jgi:hypothetical protein
VPTTFRTPVPPGCPLHLRSSDAGFARLHLLQRWANGVRGLYGVPVWLVGSALRDDNADPRDWDIRLRLSDAAFRARYGPPLAWVAQGTSGLWERTRWRWSDDCTKMSREGAVYTRLNIDFQVYPRAYWERFVGEGRMRLDTRWFRGRFEVV